MNEDTIDTLLETFFLGDLFFDLVLQDTWQLLSILHCAPASFVRLVHAGGIFNGARDVLRGAFGNRMRTDVPPFRGAHLEHLSYSLNSKRERGGSRTVLLGAALPYQKSVDDLLYVQTFRCITVIYEALRRCVRGQKYWLTS